MERVESCPWEVDVAVHFRDERKAHAFDPRDKTRRTATFTANELCTIKAGAHHKVSAASNINRICVITVPKWDEEDEHLSEIL
jgi:hypothetical protein